MAPDPIWVSEAEVVELLDLPAATRAVRAALALEHDGRAQTMDKTSVAWGDGHTLHAIGGRIDPAGVVGTKTWAHTAGGATPLLVLWDAAAGNLRAVVESFALGQLRTAAVSALATDLLAEPAAEVLAVIGSGKQALAQAAAAASVRPLRAIQVHSPTSAHRDAFVARLHEAGAAPEVRGCASVAEAVDQATVVTTVTRAREPFLHTAMLHRVAHVNALGAISPERRELADDVASGAALVVADSPVTALARSRELEAAAEVVSLGEAVASGHRPSGLSVFKAMGIGLADVAVGSEVLERAEHAGCGTPIVPPVRATPRLFGAGR